MRGALLAQAAQDGIAAREDGEPIRVLLASLARGGAERIVLEWVVAEARRGRSVELAVLHRRRLEYPVPRGVAAIRRERDTPEAFVDALAARWRDARAPVAAHLVGDALLARLWSRGLRTVPVLHNVREGWRNDPASWPATHVPLAIACAEAVREQAEAAGCRVPLATVRHRPALGAAATDPRSRRRIRESLGIGPEAFVVGAVGALKPQKDYARAVEVLARLRRDRDAVLVILGGALDAAGLAELDRVAERAAALGVAASLRLPGFADPVDPWYAAFDAVLNVSRHEGLSMATAEALGAGLPVVATDVGGQRELACDRLSLLEAGAPAEAFARALAACPVRETLVPGGAPRHPRAWSVALAWRPREGPALDTLFVTANLNAGGAQRSLVNLATALAGRQRLEVAVCAPSTHAAFPAALRAAGVPCFRPAATPDPFDAAAGILARATAGGARTLCFWNVDARVKLLVARFAPPALALVDASPGAYAYEELEAAGALGQALALPPAAYHARLGTLVTKYRERHPPRAGRVVVIPNGVALRAPVPPPPAPRFLVSGRIAPSKRLPTILEAFARVVAAHPAAQLHVVGQAEPRHAAHLEAVLAAARELPVRFHGPRPDLSHLDEPFTAAVVLGTHQGSPNAVLEAMAAGLPVIANASGGTAEMVRDGQTGWLLAEDCDADALARAMAQAAADPARARRLGMAGRALAQREHSLEVMALRYLCVFDPEAGAAGRPRPDPIHVRHELRPA